MRLGQSIVDSVARESCEGGARQAADSQSDVCKSLKPGGELILLGENGGEGREK
jgi:hypothetical protein